MEFRVADETDAENIALLHAQSWKRTYRGMMPDEFLDGPLLANRRAAWRERMASPATDQWVCVALEESRLVGFVCVYGNENARWGSYIDNLHVLPEFHRRGIGTSLMLHVAEWLCKRASHSGVYLWVMQANRRARAFYERLGARNSGVTMKRDPGDGWAPNCRYVWPDPATILHHVISNNSTR